MINPVNNNVTNEYQRTMKRTAGVDSNEHFSLRSALDDQKTSSDDEGVIYEPSDKKEVSSDKPSSQSRNDSFENSLDKAIEKQNQGRANEEAFNEEIKSIWSSVKDFFGKLFNNIKAIFGNIWDSKPLNEGVAPIKTVNKSDGSIADNTADNTADNSSGNTSVNTAAEISDDSLPDSPAEFTTVRVADSPAEYSSARIADSPAYLPADSADSLSDGFTGTGYDTSIETLEKSRDAKIHEALASGNKEEFRSLLSEDGRRMPAHSTTILTTYDSHGNIVNIDPSDENKILHGNRGVKKL